MIKHLKIIIKELVFIKARADRLEVPGPQGASYTRIYKTGPTVRIVDMLSKMILEDLDTYEKIDSMCVLLYDFGGYTSNGDWLENRDLAVTVVDVRDFFRTYTDDRILKRAWKQVKKSELWKRATCNEILRL